MSAPFSESATHEDHVPHREESAQLSDAIQQQDAGERESFLTGELRPAEERNAHGFEFRRGPVKSIRPSRDQEEQELFFAAPEPAKTPQ